MYIVIEETIILQDSREYRNVTNVHSLISRTLAHTVLNSLLPGIPKKVCTMTRAAERIHGAQDKLYKCGALAYNCMTDISRWDLKACLEKILKIIEIEFERNFSSTVYHSI